MVLRTIQKRVEEQSKTTKTTFDKDLELKHQYLGSIGSTALFAGLTSQQAHDLCFFAGPIDQRFQHWLDILIPDAPRKCKGCPLL